jgi:hypothetical protein
VKNCIKGLPFTACRECNGRKLRHWNEWIETKTGPLCRSCCQITEDQLDDKVESLIDTMVIVWSVLGRSHSTPRYSRCYPSRFKDLCFCGNHNLVRYNVVVHGCIDGFSRAIIYLVCVDNNQSWTRFSTPCRDEINWLNYLAYDESIIHGFLL